MEKEIINTNDENQQENTNNQIDNKNVPNEQQNLTTNQINNLEVKVQKETQQFLQQIDNIVNLPVKSTNQQKQNVVEKNTNFSSSSTNTSSSTTSTNASNDLKVRVVKKNDLDSDVNASLRNPVSDSNQVRVVEKNNIQTDVVASLREPVIEYKATESVRVFEPVRNIAPVIVKPNMSISSVLVEEGTKATFNVTFDRASNKAFDVSFSLLNGTANNSDFNPNFVVKDSKGNEISKNADGTYTVPLGETNLKVEVLTNNDNGFEGNENFSLSGKTEYMTSTVSGNGTIVDDGSLSNGLNDDRPLSVNNVTVNEGSPYAVFEVSGASGQLASLNLANQNNDGSNLTALEYFNGTSWAPYTSGNVALDSNGKLLVRVALSPEQETTVDGPETFNLVATNTSGTSASGLGTIKDDGTGSYFAANNNTKDSNVPSNVVLDDDRGIIVTSYGPVNEASEYAMFKITGSMVGESLDLTLQDASSGTQATYSGFTTVQYSIDGTTWTTYDSTDSTHKPVLPNNGNVFVRVNITSESDSPYEGIEKFALKANYTNYNSIHSSADTSIIDDGTGTKYGPNFDPTNGPNSNTSSLDDDRVLTVNDISVNEGSPYAVFTVTAVAGQTITLSLTDGTAIGGTTDPAPTDGSLDYKTALEYWTGSAWTAYSTAITVGSSGAVLVRNVIVNDTPYEGDHNYTLTATYTSGASKSDVGIATIKDDGTGQWFDGTSGTGSNSAPTGSVLDDDRVLTVNDISVNEGSPYAVFTVTAVAGQTVKLTLGSTASISDVDAIGNTTNPAPTDGTMDYNSNLFYFGSNGWTPYTADSYLTVPTSGSLLIGASVVNDSLYEISETFTLTAQYTNGKNSTGTATIYDDGRGQWFDGSGGTGSNSAPVGYTLNNDKPTLSINDIDVNEGSDAIFTISLSNKSTQDIIFNLTNTNVDAIGNTTNPAPTDGTMDYIPTYYVSTDGGSSWSSAVTNATIAAGTTSIKVKLATINDITSESNETFKLNATVTSGNTTNSSDYGIATIIDNDNSNHAPVAVNNDYTVNEGATLSSLNIITDDNNGATAGGVDTDADRDTLTIYKVNGVLFADLTNSTDSTYTNANGYKEVSTTNGKIYIKSDGTVQYVHNGSETTTDSFTYQVYDGITNSNTATVNYTITPVNDAPVLDLDTNNSSTATGANYLTSYALGKEGISIGDVDVGVSDIDDTNIESATITLTNNQTGDVLFAGDLPNGITVSSYDSTTGVITLSGSSTKANYEKAIEAINFYSSGSITSDRSITVLINDGTTDSNTATTTIKVATNALSITTNPTVEEGKTAVFTVSLSEAKNEATTITLSLSGTSTSPDYDSTTFMYESSAGTWIAISGNTITIPAGQTSIAVKIKTINDGALVDDGESLTLTGTITSGTTNMANTVASATTIITELPSLTVSAPSFALEGNSAIFEVSLTNFKTSTTAVTLGISGDVNSSDYNTSSFQYSIDGGNTWTTVSANVNGSSLTIPAGTTTNIPSILVKIAILGSDGADNLESMVLTATTSNSGISSFGNSASDNTIIIEPLALTVTEKKDGIATASTSVTTTVDANFTYVKVNDGANGTVVDNGNGTLTYTANTDFSGADTFSFQMINKTTGEVVTSVANVTVNAVADTPIITIGANLAMQANAFDDTIWLLATSGGGASLTSVNYTGTATDISVGSVTLNNQQYIINTFNAPSGTNMTFSYTTAYAGNKLEAKWGNLNSSTNIVTILSDIVVSSGYTTVPSSANTIVILNNTTGGNTAITLSNIQISQYVASGTKVYDLHIYDAITDTDNAASTSTTNVETLQSVTLSGIPTGATLTSNGTTITISSGAATITQAQLSNLKLTVTTAQATAGFTLTATTTSIEKNGNTATNTATVAISNADDVPTIGDQTLNVTNGNTNTNGSNIATDYSSNGTNVFSWDPSKSSIPDLYANGQKVVITYDNVNHTVKGTIDNGATTIFTTTINMADANGTTLNYTQGSSLLGVVNMIDGDIILPGGGNTDARIFQFTKSSSDATVVVDALVYAHNLIEDTPAQIADHTTAEHTVNTNNYYIGVDSNNMNAGQQLVFDFYTVGSVTTNQAGTITTHKNEVSEINIKLFNFDSAKSGDELYITVITKDPSNASGTIRENILLTQNSDYSTELQYTVRSATGNPIVAVEFLAGNESSFKLGIESIGSINYNDTFQMKYAYDITDTDTSSPVVGVVPSDSDSGITTITVGSGTVNTSLDYNLDSKIVFDSTDRIIDGGAGIDTLVLGTGINIDFDSYANSIKNIEKIDMTNSSTTNNLSNIKLQDILNITDSNHLLTILGDGNGTTDDTVSLKNTTSTINVWEKSNATPDANGFDTYVNSGNNSVSLKIDKDISVSII